MADHSQADARQTFVLLRDIRFSPEGSPFSAECLVEPKPLTNKQREFVAEVLAAHRLSLPVDGGEE
ncbi:MULTISPECIES: hypothetical protein [unclassified Sphingomonas]|uniref:hypothetical protein n=1 Tax=unclassified Sphingomonas TaxID=196159 RepID=UPI000A83A820|nr:MULTISPECIES: hypothetical protein [unclassified Sphingomonas]